MSHSRRARGREVEHRVLQTGSRPAGRGWAKALNHWRDWSEFLNFWEFGTQLCPKQTYLRCPKVSNLLELNGQHDLDDRRIFKIEQIGWPRICAHLTKCGSAPRERSVSRLSAGQAQDVDENDSPEQLRLQVYPNCGFSGLNGGGDSADPARQTGSRNLLLIAILRMPRFP